MNVLWKIKYAINIHLAYLYILQNLSSNFYHYLLLTQLFYIFIFLLLGFIYIFKFFVYILILFIVLYFTTIRGIVDDYKSPQLTPPHVYARQPIFSTRSKDILTRCI